MSNEDGKLMKIPKPRQLKLGDANFNPAYDIPQYEYVTVSHYKHLQTQKWYEKHKDASAIVCNQVGIPLFALYQSPYGSHTEMVDRFFKHLRANKLNEWEDGENELGN